MEPRISIITLGVASLDRSVQFYRDGLGFPTRYADGGPIAFFQTGGTRLALFPREHLAADIAPDLAPGHGGFSGITLAHNTRTKEEVAAVLTKAAAAGATILKTAQDVSWGGHSGYFADPDGHIWEVAWAPMFEFGPDGALLIDA